MRTFLLTASTVVVSLALATPTCAQDVDKGFSGPWATAVVGYDNLSNGSDGRGDSKDGVLYGGDIGYDVQLHHVVIGAEVELTGSSASASAPNVRQPGDNFRLEAGRDIYVGARLGYVLSPSALLYAKVGYTNGGIEETYEYAGDSIDNDVSVDGIRAGAGFEYRFGRHFFTRGEYRYSHYSDLDGYDNDIDRNQFVAGLGFRF